MSGIIWGIVNFNRQSLSFSDGINMLRDKSNIKVDKYRYLYDNNVFIGCGLQFITEESLNEELPIYSKEKDIILTCDAVIDNRENLLYEFGYKDYKVNDFSDSFYILESYLRWGEECTKHLIGTYSFVIYDKKNNKVIMIKDRLGTRSLYYYFKDNILIFSTLIKPIIEYLKGRVKENEKYIAYYLSLYGGLTDINDEETIFDGIYKVKASYIFTVSENKIDKLKYYDHLKMIKTVNKQKKDYTAQFLNIYKEAVRCRMRSIKDVGISLSSGLDSSSVAAIAADILKEKKKKLKSFTAVPVKDFNERPQNNRYEYDETIKVKELSAYIGNIENHFTDFKNCNAFNVIDKMIDIVEGPYKFIDNSYWINNIASEASKYNCKVFLKAQYGNVTVSAGDFFTCAKTFLKKLQLIKLFKMINDSCKMRKFSRYKFLKIIFNNVTFISYVVKKIKYRNYDIFTDSQVSEDLKKKYHILNNFKNMNMNLPYSKINDFSFFKKNMINDVINSFIFSISTKVSLENGVLIRDPTSDIRIIEFCLNLPVNAFVYKGYDRFLIRKSMKGYLPDKIRFNENKGIQGADFIYRLRNEKLIKKQIDDIFKDKNMKKYINLDKLKSKLSEEKSIDNVRFLIETLIFSKFINKYFIKERY